MTDSPDANHLRAGHCVPCEGGTAPLTNQEEDLYTSAVAEWTLERTQQPHQLGREFVGKNFTDVLTFLQKIGALAEGEGHHPDLLLHDYKKLKVTLFTHAIGGLSMNDFIMAAKIDQLWQEHSR